MSQVKAYREFNFACLCTPLKDPIFWGEGGCLGWRPFLGIKPGSHAERRNIQTKIVTKILKPSQKRATPPQKKNPPCTKQLHARWATSAAEYCGHDTARTYGIYGGGYAL